jgi:hypothetical protein
VVEHTDAESAVLNVANRRDAPIFPVDRLTRALEEADVGVFGAGSRDALKREVGHFIGMRERHRGFILPKSRKPFNLELTAPSR